MAAPIPINGTPVNFGFQGSGGITVTGVSGILLQSVDHSAAADMEGARDGLGAYVTRGWYDPHREATLEWVVTGTDSAAAITNSALTAVIPGTLIVVTACTSLPELIATWEVQSVKISGSNTNFKKISATIHKRAGITAVAG